MAKTSKKAKITKTEIAANATEANEMIAVMAVEELAEPIIEPEVVANEMLSIDEELAVDQAIARLEAEDEAVQEASAVAIDPDFTFDALMASIDQSEVELAVKAIAAEIDQRAAYEAVHGHPNIQKTLAAARRELIWNDRARAMLATGFDQSQINRQVHEGKRYNVYALGKLADALRALSGGTLTNAINNACMRSLFKFRKAGVPFTFENAKMAASDKIRVENAIKGLLVRHSVAPSTAPTQASSTMQAMVSLGLVSSSGGKNPTYTLTDHPAVAKLEEVLMKAA